MQWNHFWQRNRATLPYFLTIVFAVTMGCITSRHEMWRDELQAWLLARDSANPLELLRHMRYDGHPALWHLMLWPFARLSGNLTWMQGLHVALASLSAWLVFRFSPFSWGVKILLVLGYFFAYEWAVIARNYALSVTLLFTICTLFEHRWKWFPAIAAALFLLCHTNAFAWLLVLVLAITLSIEFAVAYAGRYREAERCLGRFLAGMGLVALGLFSSLRQTLPPPDSGYASNWKWEWKEGAADNVGAMVIRAYLPVPVQRLDFWNSNRFLDTPESEAGAGHIPRSHRFAWGVSALMLGSLFFLKRPWLIVPYWLGSLALITFYHVKFSGGMRHWGFLYLWFITLLWMSFSYRPWSFPQRWAEWLPAFWDRHRMKLLTPLLALHVYGASIAVMEDWTEPFSQAKAVAQWLRTDYPDRARFVFVGDHACVASSVVGYLKLDRIYYSDREDFGSYVIWDQRRYGRGNRPFNQQMADLVKKTEKDAILILNRELSDSQRSAKTTLLRQFTGPTIVDEKYWIYLWPFEGKR